MPSGRLSDSQFVTDGRVPLLGKALLSARVVRLNAARPSKDRVMRQLVLGVLFLASSCLALADEPAKRDVSQFKASDVKLDTNFTKLSVTARPKSVALAKHTGSSFDLSERGVMHLHAGSGSSVVEVWPLEYAGTINNVHFYREGGGSPFSWLWIFSSDKVYFIPDGSGMIFEFDDSKLLSKIP
jgi:hypothetical protein